MMSKAVDQPAAVTIVALRAESYSAEDNSVIISLRVKYSTADRFFSVPVECLRDLVVDLQRLNTSPPIQPE